MKYLFSFSCLAAVCLFTWLGTPIIHAQVNAERHTFRTMGWNTSLSNLFYFSEGKYQQLRVRDAALSGFYRYLGGKTLTLYKKTKDSETQEDIYTPVSRVQLPDGTEQSLIVFFGSSEDKNVFRAIAYNDSLRVIGEKDILIANFSPVPLAFEVGDDDRFTLSPASSRLISGKKNNRHVPLKLAAYRESSWRPEYSTKLRVRDGTRYMLFFRDSRNPRLGIEGMTPTIISENVEVIKLAMRNPNPEGITGVLPGGVDTFDFSDSDRDFMPEPPPGYEEN